MIDPTYERWLFRDNLLSYIQPEAVEAMQKTYGTTLEQQAIERVQNRLLPVAESRTPESSSCQINIFALSVRAGRAAFNLIFFALCDNIFVEADL